MNIIVIFIYFKYYYFIFKIKRKIIFEFFIEINLKIYFTIEFYI